MATTMDVLANAMRQGYREIGKVSWTFHELFDYAQPRYPMIERTSQVQNGFISLVNNGFATRTGKAPGINGSKQIGTFALNEVLEEETKPSSEKAPESEGFIRARTPEEHKAAIDDANINNHRPNPKKSIADQEGITTMAQGAPRQGTPEHAIAQYDKMLTRMDASNEKAAELLKAAVQGFGREIDGMKNATDAMRSAAENVEESAKNSIRDFATNLGNVVGKGLDEFSESQLAIIKAIADEITKIHNGNLSSKLSTAEMMQALVGEMESRAQGFKDGFAQGFSEGIKFQEGRAITPALTGNERAVANEDIDDIINAKKEAGRASSLHASPNEPPVNSILLSLLGK